MDIMRLIARHVTSPLMALKEGSDHLKVLGKLEKSQYRPFEEIQALRLERTRRLLVHAYQNCPFYSERFRQAGFEPHRLASLDELAALPLLTKADIQQNKDRLTAANVDPKDLIANQTGGSTGSPLRFYVDRMRTFSRKATTIRHDRWSGRDIGTKVAALWGGEINRRLTFKQKLLNATLTRILPLNTINISNEMMSAFVEKLLEYKPQTYLAYANSMYLFARFIKENGIENYHRPHSITTSAELLTKEQRELIEQVFQCPVFNRYGCREVSLIASECPVHDGMHIAAESILVEVVKGDQVAEKGQMGEIVVTDLLNFGMPLIRYKIGDMGILLDKQCSCGRGLPLMEITGGRTTDFLVTPDGRVVSGASLTIYFVATVPGIAQAQLVQERNNFISIRVVKGKDFSKTSTDMIAERIRKYFGPDMEFEIDYVARIDKTSTGKYRFSICKLDPMEYLARS